MLMLCLGIACIYVIPVRLSRAITRSSVICTLFFIIYGFQSQQNDRYGKSPITRRPDNGRLSGRNNRSVRAMAWFRPVRDRCAERGCYLRPDRRHVAYTPLQPDGKHRRFPELSDRSNRKDGRYHQRHDTDAACG